MYISKIITKYNSPSGERTPAAADAPRRPAVPRVTDHVATPLRRRRQRNLVHKNALDVMVAEAPQREDPAYVDAPDGHTQSLAKSGMVPVYSVQKVILMDGKLLNIV